MKRFNRTRSASRTPRVKCHTLPTSTRVATKQAKTTGMPAEFHVRLETWACHLAGLHNVGRAEEFWGGAWERYADANAIPGAFVALPEAAALVGALRTVAMIYSLGQTLDVGSDNPIWETLGSALSAFDKSMGIVQHKEGSDWVSLVLGAALTVVNDPHAQILLHAAIGASDEIPASAAADKPAESPAEEHTRQLEAARMDAQVAMEAALSAADLSRLRACCGAATERLRVGLIACADTAVRTLVVTPPAVVPDADTKMFFTPKDAVDPYAFIRRALERWACEVVGVPNIDRRGRARTHWATYADRVSVPGAVVMRPLQSVVVCALRAMAPKPVVGTMLKTRLDLEVLAGDNDWLEPLRASMKVAAESAGGAADESGYAWQIVCMTVGETLLPDPIASQLLRAAIGAAETQLVQLNQQIRQQPKVSRSMLLQQALDAVASKTAASVTADELEQLRFRVRSVEAWIARQLLKTVDVVMTETGPSFGFDDSEPS